MAVFKKAIQPFTFCTRLHLSELTGLKASTLGQLLKLIEKIPDSSIYNHTHAFLQQLQYLSCTPTNDFAYWVNEVLGERKLGERLLRIDTVEYPSINSLHEKIILTISAYLKMNPLARLKFVKTGEEFNFIKSVCFIIPTTYSANDLFEFSEILKKVTIDSVYFHVFESRLRLERKTNDFSNWLETSLGEKELAGEISKFNPYDFPLEDLRKEIINLIEKRILS